MKCKNIPTMFLEKETSGQHLSIKVNQNEYLKNIMNIGKYSEHNSDILLVIIGGFGLVRKFLS